MSLVSGLAIYFIIWWVVLFAVLPWGVRNHHEEGVEDEMAFAGAPVQPRIALKALVTTVVAGIIFAAIWVSIEYRLVTLDTFGFLPDVTRKY
jgi:predicted secreted protein